MVSALFLTGVLWGAVVVVAALTALAWRQRPKPGATPFAIAMLSATWWILFSSLGLTTTDSALRVLFAKIEWAGIVYVPVAWAAFALAYTGRSERLTPRNLALLSLIPTLTLALGLTNGAGHTLLFELGEFETASGFSLLHRSFGPWFWVHTAYTYLLLAVSTGLVGRLVLSRRPLYRGQATALFLMIGAPWAANVVYVTGNSPVPAVDPTPYAFVISGAAGLAALTQLRFLDAIPITSRVAQESVLRRIDVGVVVLDTDGRAVELNPRARTMLGVDDAAAAGTRAADFFPVEISSVEDLDALDGEVVELDHSRGPVHYELSVTSLTDAYGTVTGRIVLLQDVTERRTRVQRLNVLNRVLRHNLRNEMNVIYGFADRLRGDDPPVESLSDDIQEKADELIHLSEKAREIDAVLDVDDGTAPTDVTEVVDIERKRILDETPDATVEVRASDEPVYTAGVAGTILRNLLENAIEHNPDPSPWVGVDVRATDGTVVLDVEDDGPGIPGSELSALDGDAETPLDHGSGIGLWLVSWGVASAGGDLSVEEREPTGTRILIELPRFDPPDGQSSASSG